MIPYIEVKASLCNDTGHECLSQVNMEIPET